MKQISLLKSVHDKKWMILPLIIGTVLLIVVFRVAGTKPGVFLTLAFVLVFVVKRVFFARLNPKEGDVVLFWGLPGSGKTMFLTKLWHDCRGKMDVYSNYDLPGVPYFDKRYIGHCEFHYEKTAGLLFDEGSLNGFDNRDFKRNFSDPAQLEYMKKIRHHSTWIAFSNQGFEELDVKVRTLTSKNYYVENHGLWSVAYRLIPDMFISQVDGQPHMGYRFPTFLDRLFDPTTQLYAIHFHWGKFYQSKQPRTLASYSDLHDQLSANQD